MRVNQTRLQGPPRARVVFRVGVIGHLPNRLTRADPPRLAEVLGQILKQVSQTVQKVASEPNSLYAPGPGLLRAISPLAEGTDRVFASCALDLGYQLCCVTPFFKKEFENDFKEPASKSEFTGLLERAEKAGGLTLFEMAGSRADESGAYLEAGRVVLNQSDLLIAVWDGQRLGKKGGTEDTLAEAVSRGVKVALVSAIAPHPWSLMEGDDPHARFARLASDSTDDLAKVDRVVLETLESPPVEKDEDTSAGASITLSDFLAERQQARTWGGIWKCFRDILADFRFAPPVSEVADYEKSVEADWDAEPETPFRKLTQKLKPFYAWPDRLAVYYSDQYRSAFVVAYGLGALAVGLALVPISAHTPYPNLNDAIHFFCYGGEFLAIWSMLYLIYKGRKAGWHERSLEYRLIAECVRHLRLVVPLGGERPFPQASPQVLTYGPPNSSWAVWYIRGVERELGLPGAQINSSYMQHSLNHLATLLADQIRFHESSAQRHHHMEKRLDWIKDKLLFVTIGACVYHQIDPVANLLQHHHFISSVPDWISSKSFWITLFLIVLCGFIPAFGTALSGVVSQGEFRRVGKRSEGMATQLAQIREQVKQIQETLEAADIAHDEEGLNRVVTQARGIATKTAQLMINEVLDWRIIFLDQPLQPAA